VRSVAIAFLIAVTATSARADDDPLAEAMRLEAQLQYEPALVIIERAIAQGGNDRERLVTLHLFAGKLAAGLDREPVAIDHFARVLALAPSTTFSKTTSPKITEPFDAARARTAPLAVTATFAGDAVTIAAPTDPLGLVVGIAVVLVEGAREREVRDLQRRRIEFPAAARPTEVRALDAFGNIVWSKAISQRSHSGNHRPVDDGVGPWIYPGAFALLAAGGAGVCAWRFNVAQKEWTRKKNEGGHDFSELQAIEQRSKRWALAANIGFGVAGAAVVVAIVVKLRTPKPVPVVTGDSVGLALTGTF
jgi:hypothetical protein